MVRNVHNTHSFQQFSRYSCRIIVGLCPSKVENWAFWAITLIIIICCGFTNRQCFVQCFLDEWRNTLINVCIAMATIVSNVLIITCGVCAFTRIRGKHLLFDAKLSNYTWTCFVTLPSLSQYFDEFVFLHENAIM